MALFKHKPLRLTIQFVEMIIFCGFIILSGCDVVYRYLDKAGAEEKELLGELAPLEKNTRAEEIQVLLKIYGYYSGKVDGVLGANTRSAIERFQQDNGLKITRFVDRKTLGRLVIFQEDHLIVKKRLNIKLIQEILKGKGFYTGAIDGKWGPKTKEAMEDFQAAHELEPDGKAGYKTLSQLAIYLK